MGSLYFNDFKIEPENKLIKQAVFSAAPETQWSSSDLGLPNQSDAEAAELSRGSVLDSLDSIIVKDLGDDSGSDDDLTIEAKRIMRDRKREKQQLEKLGTLTPISTSTLSSSSSVPLGHSCSKTGRDPIPMRKKRADTQIQTEKEFAEDLIKQLAQIENLDRGEEEIEASDGRVLTRAIKSHTDRAKSVIQDSVRRPSSRKTLTFSTVEELQFEKTGENKETSSDEEEPSTSQRSKS